MTIFPIALQAMQQSLLDELHNAAAIYVDMSMSKECVVNIPVVAEKLRLRFEYLNIALEDFEALVLRAAQIRTFPIEFDGRRQMCPKEAQLNALSSPIILIGE